MKYSHYNNARVMSIKLGIPIHNLFTDPMLCFTINCSHGNYYTNTDRKNRK